ncbi:SIR2-like protein [Pseudoxanthomonas sp. 3HH-4]|uniref:SIR2 family protein n=1 Tax=Pseudoxanthomonas sp. 3HH-4 TaxID=1690214 RepID=UPI001151D10C|nr:SIR2 family protein [Pseudoxanthomonas sp. 3HH-4]TQM12316.1 SIR2-like protein [Pseudoxanthomonas sp. 3HH-4]
MPRFIKDGPVVPDDLVQDLEDDRVIFFCGAGISMGAGLPSYAGLVKHCYTELGMPVPGKHSKAWDWPDRMLGILESNYEAAAVRRVVSERLSKPPRDLRLHESILKLSRLRNSGGTRLITTNFDTYFEQAQKGVSDEVPFHSGPVLPIPRNDHIVSWKSVVYLHGRLVEDNNHHLVLTSADFGRAYLTDAWAARFVARLFAEFTVLFVGYSLNDPVLRYMTDAFAAERAASRTTYLRNKAYIFVARPSTSPDPAPYRQRRLEPIFYKKTKDHRYLRDTVIAWAKARQDYLANTAGMIQRIAPTQPASLDPSEAANVLWAVAGRPKDQGHGARVFARLADAPHLTWLDEIEQHDKQLVAEHATEAEQASKQNMPIPPAPQLLTNELFPHNSNLSDHRLSPTALALTAWLVRHLASVDLVERVIEKIGHGRRLHEQFRFAIREEIEREKGLRDGFLRFWRCISAEGDWAIPPRPRWQGPFHTASKSFTDSHAEPWLRQEVLAGLRPSLTFLPAYYQPPLDDQGNPTPDDDRGSRLNQLARAKVVLSEETHIASLLSALRGKPFEGSFCASIITELTSKLKSALDLFALVGEAGPNSDPSIYQRPSIVPHEQNRNREKWTCLFDLIWLGWQHLDGTDAAASKRLIEGWFSIDYPAFRRLALAATSRTAHLSPSEKMGYLLNV